MQFSPSRMPVESGKRSSVVVVTLMLCRAQIVVPPLPGKAWKRQLPFRSDEGIFDEEFIEERKKGLELFINK